MKQLRERIARAVTEATWSLIELALLGFCMFVALAGLGWPASVRAVGLAGVVAIVLGALHRRAAGERNQDQMATMIGLERERRAAEESHAQAAASMTDALGGLGAALGAARGGPANGGLADRIKAAEAADRDGGR